MAQGDPELSARAPRGVLAHRWLVLVLALVALATLGSFANGFVWDDEDVILRGTVIHDPVNLPSLFLHDAMYAVHGASYGQAVQLDTYRPVTMSTFVWDAAWSGTDPFSYHLTNWLAHLGVVALVYALALALLGGGVEDRVWAAVAAGFVGLHPLLAEAHVWINGRSDVFAALFGLGAVLAWLRGRAVAAGFLLLAGLLSKEVLLTALPAVALLGWRRGELRSLGPMAVAAVAALGLRTMALAGLKASEGGDHLLRALELLPWLLLDGLRFLLLPTRGGVRLLSEEYAGIGAAQAVAGVVAVAALAALGWRLWRQAPEVGFGLLWAAGTLAPVALIASSGWWGFGRYLYLPAVGLGIALASLLRSASAGPSARVTKLGAAAFLLLLGTLLAWGVKDWRSTESLSRAVIRANPELSLGWRGLASMYAEAGQTEEAIMFAREALARSPSGRARAILGSALLAEGRAAEALPELERAVAGQAYRLDLAYDLGVARRETGDFDGALQIARAGQERFPKQADFFHLEALILAAHDPVASLPLTVEALRREPRHLAARGLPAAILRSHPQAEAYRVAVEAAVPAVEPSVVEVLAAALAEGPRRSTLPP